MDVEDLLREGAWVRALARRLVVDDAAADDVVQDTWVAAMRSAPAEREQLRPWLARVVRNFAASARRSDAHRAAREADVARHEPEGSASDSLERLEAQRVLVEALAELAEPYRTTLMRRYFDGWTAADIARDDGIPAATVRWRIARGLADLRARLERRYGDRSAFVVAFLPLTRAPMPSVAAAATAGGATWIGILAMNTATRASIAAIVLLTASLGVWFALDVRDVAAPPTPVSAASAQLLVPAPGVEDPAAHELAPSTDGVARTEVPAPVATKPAESAAVDESVLLEGRFVDESGRGIGGVRIVQPLATNGAVVESDAHGGFAYTLDPTIRTGLQILEARAVGWATHFSLVEVSPGTKVNRGQILLVPGGSIAGTVVDENGRPIAGARVLATKPALDDDVANLRRMGLPNLLNCPEAKSGADGSFQIEGVPAELARAWAASDGRRWGISEPLEVPRNGVIGDVVLTLVPLAADERIEGIVLDPSGQPVPRAGVSFHYDAPDRSSMSYVKSGEDGRFRIVLERKVPHDLSHTPRNKLWADVVMRAVEPGTLDVVLQVREARLLELVVRDEKGAPIEAFGYGLSTPDGRAQTWTGDQDEPHPGGRGQIAMPSTPFQIEVWAKGRARVELGPIDPAAPPEPLECTLEPVPGLSGRVLSDGTPVGGARVMLHRLVSPDDRFDFNGFPSRLQHSAIEKTTTDADGRYLITVRDRGSYALVCDAPGHALAEVSPLEIDPRVGLSGVDVQVLAGGAIEGRVLAPTGRDAAGIIVGINRFDCRPRTQRVGADGRYRFESLTPGAWSVTRAKAEVDPGSSSSSSWSEAGGPSAFVTDCVVESGRTTVFDLDLRETFEAALVGHVTVNGEPAAGWTVALRPKDVAYFAGEPPSGVVDPRGEVRVALPRPATYGIELVPIVENGTPVRFTRDVVIRPGDNAFTADLECGSLEGTLGGDREVRVDCTAIGAAEWAFQGTLRVEAGRFRVAHVPVGRVNVRGIDTRAEGGWATVFTKDVEIARGATATVEMP